MRKLAAWWAAAAFSAIFPVQAWSASSTPWTRTQLMEEAFGEDKAAAGPLPERAERAVSAASAVGDRQGYVNGMRLLVVAVLATPQDMARFSPDLANALKEARSLGDWRAASELRFASILYAFGALSSDEEEKKALAESEEYAQRIGGDQLSPVYLIYATKWTNRKSDLAAQYATKAHDASGNRFDKAEALFALSRISFSRSAQGSNPELLREAIKKSQEALEILPPERFPVFSLDELLLKADFMRIDKQFAEADRELARAFDLALSSRQPVFARRALLHRARLALSLSQPETALKRLDDAAAVAPPARDELGAADLARARALAMMEPPRFAEAAAALADAKAAVVKIPVDRIHINYLTSADYVYTRAAQFKLAYENLKEMNRLQLKEVSENQANAAAETQIKFDTARKEEENRRLLAEQAEARANRNVLLIALGSIVVLTAGLAYFLFLRSRQRTALFDLSQALTLSNQKLTAVNENRSKLLVAACHDLRQPAHSLGMLAELASLAGASSVVDAQLRSIKRCSTMLSHMLSELLDMSLLEQGDYVVRARAVPLKPLLEELSAQFEAACAAKGLAFHAGSSDAVVFSDANLLRRTLLNLLSNALKYTDEGLISLEVSDAADGTVALTVRDTGIGMAPEQVERALADYSRLPAGFDRGGLGIGLAVVRRATEALGHELQVTSAPGRGTAARLVLQRVADRAPAEPFEPAVASASSRRFKVALAENDVESRDGVTRLLEAWGYDVVAFASCGQAREGLLQPSAGQAVDIIISDYHLADGEGLPLILEWRSALDRPQMPAILMTGDLNHDVLAQCQAEAIELLYKPVIPARLQETMESVLRRPPIDARDRGAEIVHS